MSNNILGEILRHHDDSLQHVGVKGMKWGVRRAAGKATSSVKKKVTNVKDGVKKKVGDIKTRGAADKDAMRRRRSGEITRKQAKAEQWTNFHNLQMNNKKYKKSYEKRIAKGQAPKKAMRRAYSDATRRRRLLMVVATPLAIKAGRDYLGM